MSRSALSMAASAVGFVLVAGATSAQPVVQQSLQDTWVATSGELVHVDYREIPTALVAKNPGDAARDFRALVFEQPALGGAGTAVRNLVAVDGTKLWRFADGANETPPTLLLDAGSAPAQLRYVNTVAISEVGTVLFSGYSKPKRVFELWELDPALPQGHPQRVQLKVTGSPQLLDAVYVAATDAVAGSALSGGGLLAVAARDVLFFPASQNHATFLKLFDTRSLPIKSNTQLLSVDLVRKTDALMLATSERTLLTTAPALGAVATFASIPDIAGRNCGNIKSQRLLVRSARGGGDATSIVSDVCGQVLRYDFTDPSSQLNQPVDTAIYGTGFVAIAVGEGNEILCLANEQCTLTDGFTARIESPTDTELLVLQFDNLCDRRVAGAACAIGDVQPGNVLDFNSLLPQSVQDSLAANGVTITIPPYMYGAGFNGRFGALLVQSDSAGAAAAATVQLDIEQLLGFELGVQVGFPRTTPTSTLLRQDIAAYAPDNPAFPTVRGFEATPSTTGVINPMIGNLRGFSAVLYGLQHDLNPAGSRASDGGLPPGTALDYGSPPLCNLVQGPVQFIAKNDPQQFFINLAACLFADQETLLRSVIPNGAFVFTNDRNTLLSNLENAKDKLIKALNAAGPNTGVENFQSVLTQVGNYETAVAATAFTPQFAVYKNELLVRSQVFRFNLVQRAYPSLPPGGF